MTSLPLGVGDASGDRGVLPFEDRGGRDRDLGHREAAGDVDLAKVAAGVVMPGRLVVVAGVEKDGIEPGGGVRRGWSDSR